MAVVEIDLEEHEANTTPKLFNFSVMWPNDRADGAVAILRASTSVHHGTEPHQRVRPAATIVEIPLDEEGLQSAHEALAEACRIYLRSKIGDAH